MTNCSGTACVWSGTMAPHARYSCVHGPHTGVDGAGPQWPSDESSYETHSDSCKHRHCCAPIPRLTLYRWSSGSYFAGGLRSLSKRFENISEWRFSASGLTGRSRVPHRCCWGCSHGLPWRPSCYNKSGHVPRAQRPGMPRRSRPSLTQLRWCVVICGLMLRLFQRRSQ